MMRRVLRVLTAVALLSGLAVAAPLSVTPAAAAETAIDDISPDNSDLDATDPDGASGGRVNGLANSVADDDIFFAATEYGGLYKTLDGGLTWSHLESHLPMVMWDVETDPENGGIVYATSFFDGKEDPASGIARSEDGGATWAHNVATPADGFCNNNRRDEPWAFGIDIRDDDADEVAVGTNCGVAISTDRGTTWTFRDPTPNNGNLPADVWDVVVQPGVGGTSIIDTCGDDGHARSLDGGATWNPVGTGQPTGGRCSLGVSPDESGVLFMAASDNFYYESDDGGATWNSLGQVALANGRVPFVAVNDRGGNAFNVWGGGQSLYRGDCTTPAVPNPLTPRCPQANTWAGGFSRNGIGNQTGAHDDVGDVAFDINDGCPRLFANDGGVYYRITPAGGDCHTPDGSAANGPWEQPDVGPHALWLFAMTGADRFGAEEEDLYFGLQDNGSFATLNAGANPPDWTNRDCCDVFDIVADDTLVVYSFCCASRLVVRNVGMAGPNQMTPANQPPGNLTTFRPGSTIVQVGDGSYVVLTNQGAFLTDDITAGSVSWTELGNTPASACGLQTGVLPGFPDSRAFYVQVGTCNERSMGNSADQLWKYVGIDTNGTWERVDDNIDGGTGVGIFAVDESNPNRLYASDIRQEADGGPRMVFSTDGGQSWEQDHDLDLMMTGNGAFEYMTEHGPPNFPHDSDNPNKPRGYPQPTMVAFDPDDPDLIVAGGRDSGVFLSTDGGGSWGLLTDPLTPHVSGVPHLPRPWFAYFDHVFGETNLYIGTQGRGVWRFGLVSADVGIEKTDAPDPAIAGETLIYSLDITNDGPDTAEAVVVQDELPEQATFLTSSPDVCVETDEDVLLCDLGDLADGESVTVDIEVLLDADTVSEEPAGPKGITNTATVSTSGSVDPNPDNDTASASTIVNDLADLLVTKSADPAQVDAGEEFTFTIFVDNLGPSDARDVVLTDTLLSSSSNFTMGTPTSSHGTCTNPAPDGSFTCDIALLPEGDRATIEVDVTSQEGGIFEDEAVADSTTPDPDSSNNRATATVPVTAMADLAIAKIDDPDPVVAGETLTYTVDVANSFDASTAENVVISDNLPTEVSIVSVDGGPGTSGCNAGTPGDPTDPTTCAYGTLAPNATATMTIVVRVAPDAHLGDGLIENDAQVTSDTFDRNTNNNFVTEPTEVIGVADLAVAKSDSPDPVQAGGLLTYRIPVTNNGPSTAEDVTLTDTLPRGDATPRATDFEEATISNGQGECVVQTLPPPSPEQEPGQQVICDLGTVDPNEPEPVIVTISVTVRSATEDGTVLENHAALTSSTTDPNAANSETTEETTVIGVADVAITLTSDQDIYKPSSTIQYTITVDDLGPSDAREVVVTHNLPEGKHFVYRFDTANCTRVDFVLTCQLGTVAAGTSTSFDVYVTMKGKQDVVDSTASVDALNPDPDTSNNTSFRQVLVKSV